MSRKIIYRVGALVLGFVAFVLSGLLIVGIILPGEWEITRSVDIEASPKAVYNVLEDLAAWDEWTPWGEVESTFDGPTKGEGAIRRWEDDLIGEGVLQIVEADALTRVTYSVDVDEGSINIAGTFLISPRAQGTHVEWTERADFGQNPLLGWTVLFMESSQEVQMDSSLVRLRRTVEGMGG